MLEGGKGLGGWYCEGWCWWVRRQNNTGVVYTLGKKETDAFLGVDVEVDSVAIVQAWLQASMVIDFHGSTYCRRRRCCRRRGRRRASPCGPLLPLFLPLL